MSLVSMLKSAVTGDEYPGLASSDSYDDGFPDNVAGHIATGARIDPSSDVVPTQFGVDYGYAGERVGDVADRHPMKGTAETHHDEELIANYIKKEKRRDDRKPVTDAADAWRSGNLAVPNDGSTPKLVAANKNRANVTVTNQGTVTVYLSHDRGAAATGPNTVYLPVGSSRTFTHKSSIYMCVASSGAAGLVDFVEENYDTESL